MRRPAWILVAACLLALASGASAQPASPEAPPWQLPATDPEVFYPSPRVDVFADLTFTREPGASICPSEWWVRNLAAARVIGSDPFTRAPRGVYVGRVSLTLSRTRDGFTSKLKWEMPNGKVYASPRYRHHGGATFLDCKEALEYAIVDLSSKFLILSIELGEKYARKGRPPYCPELPPSEPRAPAPPCVQPTPYDVDWFKEWPLSPLPKPEPEPPKLPEPSPLAIRLGGAAWVELVAADRLSVGFSLDAGVRRDWFSIGVELHGVPPLGATFVRETQQATFAALSGALLPCAHVGWFVGCLEAMAGGIVFPGQGLPARGYGAFGVRPAVEFPVVPSRFSISVAVTALAVINPPAVIIQQPPKNIFQATGGNVGMGVGALFEVAPSKAR